MKKTLIPSLAVLVVLLTACGSDEPEQKSQLPEGVISSVYENENDTHFDFVLDPAASTATITAYNVVFTIGERQSPAMTIRIPGAKYTTDTQGRVVTITDTGITPEMLRGTTWTPMPGDDYLVTDLSAMLALTARTYTLAFNCHGGDFDSAGSIVYAE